MNNALLVDARRIVSQLAQFQGAAALNVVARSYPRFAPAEDGPGFRQFQCDFPCDNVPLALGVPGDSDEVTVTVRGALGQGVAKPEFRKAVEEKLATAGWDVRVYFDNRQQNCSEYQIKVFTTTPC